MKIFIGIIILIICCVLAFTITHYWSNPDKGCESGTCPVPEDWKNGSDRRPVF